MCRCAVSPPTSQIGGFGAGDIFHYQLLSENIRARYAVRLAVSGVGAERAGLSCLESSAPAGYLVPPLSLSSFATAAVLLFAVQCKGVLPSSVVALTSAPLSINRCTSAVSPLFTAARNSALTFLAICIVFLLMCLGKMDGADCSIFRRIRRILTAGGIAHSAAFRVRMHFCNSPPPHPPPQKCPSVLPA